MNTDTTTVNMLELEQELWQQGYVHIAGVDEVGRGCLFGDVVTAAVILPQDLVLEGVNDSKKLTEKKRNELYDIIIEHALCYSIATLPAETIDEINIKQASRLAMKMAVEQLEITPDAVLVDAETLDIAVKQSAIIKGDARSQSIAAASILAKVTRDRLCHNEWHSLYPHYALPKHKGYATKMHYEALAEHGPTPMHRKSFLKKII